MDNCSIIIMTHNVNIVNEIIAELSPLPVLVFNGQGFPSFSKLANTIIASAEHDNVIFINYKARPRKEHIYKTLDLLSKGYGFVGLYRFGFFGINKNLIKKIGFFDERYVGGEYADDDIIIRLLEHNIALYFSEEITYHYKPSLWDNTTVKQFFLKKWTQDSVNNIIYKNLPEEEYNYELNIKNPIDNFLDRSQTYIWNEDYDFYRKNTIKINY